MKKLIFFIGILILVFLSACPPDYEEGNNQYYYTPPDLSPSSVTVYLDGYEPARSRAMNLEFAKMGCDYFEVVFLCNDGGTYKSARGQWKIGETARVRDIVRNINYNSISDTFGSGFGSAVLLAGKSDKTIMAIGRLQAGSTSITSSTTSVTFEVAAIKTGVNDDLTLSSFLTAANGADPSQLSNVTIGNTEKIVQEIGAGNYFLAFKLLPPPKQTKAVYTFSLHSGNFSSYPPLIVSSKGTIEKRHPSYTMFDGTNVNVNAIIILDELTTVSMDNNQTSGAVFNRQVEFTFNTATTYGGSIFGLAFEIPVYALSNESIWYIRPGYGVFKYEIDNGVGGIGGAVLIRTGDPPVITPSGSFKIEIKQAPDKWRYRWIGAPNEGPDPAEYNRFFQYTGLVVQLQRLDGTPITDHPSFLGTSTIPNTMLSYYIGGARVTAGYELPTYFYGLIEVRVRFTDPYSLVHSEDTFYILASGRYTPASGTLGNTTLYDYANPLNLTNGSIINVGTAGLLRSTLESGTANNTLRIIRLTASINIDEANLQLGTTTGIQDSRLFIFVAGNNNIVLGRDPMGGQAGRGQRINIRGNFSGLASFYFGRWPFAGLIRSPTNLDDTRDFIVNAGGTTSLNFAYNNKMITDGTTFDNNGIGGGIYNVDLGKGVSIRPAPDPVTGISLLH